MKIFVTNLGKYNEGEIIGEWLDLPASEEDIEECLARIGISDEPDVNGQFYEEYFISDYDDVPSELAGELGEYTPLDELNEIAEAIEGVDEEVINTLIYFGVPVSDFWKAKDEVIVYPDCRDMTDVAEVYVDNSGLLNDIPENIARYFDYKAYGRDLKIEGHFRYANGCYYQYIG